MEQAPECVERAGTWVRHFRQVLLWPLQLMSIREGTQIQRHWELIDQGGDSNPWREVIDEFTGDPTEFKERHYHEFVTFLPHAQRFLYGEGRAPGAGVQAGGSAVRVFRRGDVAAVRITPDAGDAPLTCKVVHVDLYFFYDIDVIVLAVEIQADELPLRRAQDLLYRFGRAYPSGWEASGQGVHCLHRTEWLDAQGQVLSVSDYEKREKYLTFVCRHRAPCIAAHWAFLLRPLVAEHSDEAGPIRYRQIEYYRMPVMGYLALENPRHLGRADFVRLGLVTAPAEGERLPHFDLQLADFESRYCYDRYWSAAADGPDTRYLCCGHALVVVGNAHQRVFVDAETGALGQFRHQHFLLFLIAHFHRAALLMFSDRLMTALNKLDIHNAESVKHFKRAIRQTFEIFLRFTHRYWCHELSDQAQTKALYRLCTGHLNNDALFADMRQEIEDMSEYLDSDSLRRQANTVIRLTVVTIFGLIGTLSTGFLGMNLISAAESPLPERLAIFLLFALPVLWLVLYTVVKAKRLSDFLEALSDEHLGWKQKLAALLRVWVHKGSGGR